MADDTLEIPSTLPPKLRALYADPGYQQLLKADPQQAHALEDWARTGVMPGGATGGAPRPPATATFGRPIMSEVSRKAKMSAEGADLLKQAQDLQNFYNARIKPKLDSGKISSTGQGMEYTEPGWARLFGYNIDPDVARFITQTGPFAQKTNAYYSAGSGNKAGVGQYKVGVVPHVPHPPGSPGEVLGLSALNPFGSSEDGQQWDLQKMGGQLGDIIDYINLEENRRGVSPRGAAPSGGGDSPEDPVTAAERKHGLIP